MAERARILIVDDEPLNVDYLEQELEDLGYETVSAANGAEALEKVASERPDLVLLDVMMPVMDGFTACRRLKEDEATRLIPVVIMTALDAIDDRVKGIEAGADDFLTKPVDERELVARIRTALRHKQAVDRKLGELRSVRDHFAKFVPEAVKRLVAENPEAPALAKHEQDVSVLFLDISGYGRLSETLAPGELDALMERCFSAFLDRVQEGGGDINETAGDGFMAIFEDAGHGRRAVDTALGLLAAAAEISRAGGGPPLAVHMGVNSGTALVGSSRFEGHRNARWTFTATGTVTNLAARLAGDAEAGEILIGPETAARLDDAYELESLGRRRFKNITAEVEVHRVLARAR